MYNLIPVVTSPSCCPQLFLHSVFGYRGIVLFPWHARLYDRDITPPMSDRWASVSGLQQTLVLGLESRHYEMFCFLQQTRAPRSSRLQGGEGENPHLLPGPDWHPRLSSYREWLPATVSLALLGWWCSAFSVCWVVFQSQRSQTEAVTFLANHDDSRALYAIPGMQPHAGPSLYITVKLAALLKWFSVDQVWIMWAMKTSCHITLQSRFLFSMSSLSASSSTTQLNVNTTLPPCLYLTANISILLIFFGPVPFSLFSSSSIHSQRHPEGVAGEEPPLAGAVRCPQGDHGEHPRHRYPLLHGHEGVWTNRVQHLFTFLVFELRT